MEQSLKAVSSSIFTAERMAVRTEAKQNLQKALAQACMELAQAILTLLVWKKTQKKDTKWNTMSTRIITRTRT